MNDISLHAGRSHRSVLGEQVSSSLGSWYGKRAESEIVVVNFPLFKMVAHTLCKLHHVSLPLLKSCTLLIASLRDSMFCECIKPWTRVPPIVVTCPCMKERFERSVNALDKLPFICNVNGNTSPCKYLNIPDISKDKERRISS